MKNAPMRLVSRLGLSLVLTVTTVGSQTLYAGSAGRTAMSQPHVVDPGRYEGGFSLAPSIPVSTTTHYAITDLGSLGGSQSHATDINNRGEVVGWSHVPSGGQHAFLWLPEPAYDLPAGLNDLGTLGGPSSDAGTINEQGQVAGSSQNSNDQYRAFRWQSGQMSNLGTLGGPASNATGLNNFGHVSGSADNDDGHGRAALWLGGSASDLGALGQAFAINDSGQAAGVYYPGASSRAAIWQGGALSDLGLLPGATWSGARAINNLGQATGNSGSHAFIWLPEPAYGLPAGMNALGVGTWGWGINDHGQVVGQNGTAGFLWHSGVITPLLSLLPGGSGWSQLYPKSINNSGQIVGFGIHNGQGRAFLMSPPKPWTLLFYLAGDNDLGSTYAPIANRLEAGANNPAVNVVAFWDNTPLDDSAYLKIQPDTNLAQAAQYEDGVNRWPQGEADMSDPDTLAAFVTWAIQHYPAEHYALILDNHGSGLAGGLCDDSGGLGCASQMNLVEMQQALIAAQSQTGVKLDVLFLAMCLMGMLEDAYQLRDVTHFYVANEHVQWALDEPYTFYVSGLLTDTLPADAATLLADAYADAASAGGVAYTISAVDMLRLGEVVSATNALAAALDTHLEVITPTLATVVAGVQRFDNEAPDGLTPADTYIDLYDFAALAHTELGAYPDIVAAAGAVMQSVSTYVIYESHGSDADTPLDESHGVSIFFPATASSFYSAANYDFAVGVTWGAGAAAQPATVQANSWGAWLVRYFQVTQPGGPDDPTPPEPITKLSSLWHLFLPMTLR